MPEYDNTNRGALFRNTRKESDRHPDYTGKLNVGGIEYTLSAWLKTSAKGTKFLSLTVTPAEPAQSRASNAQPQRRDAQSFSF
jgi:uncharacterized protein (DUF736 family)